ncbi:hypothetical protein LPB03_07845 [Polaribacter vadi]|uniref:Uncharacterized protein n=1 Tax=Polaribacter vadi TaxID=1774273 RepID=A0A1B8U358_9FLAO|nr:hypothetical protein [Polaribacter vadi]AOW17378.1 hypothetical protein LPB03_07845 [Polaribacter vadi]OBY66314.1 hypothetical protein LPB3_01230 [Polaribacter vadi]
MNIDLKFLEPYLIYIVFGFISLLILYIRSFVQESAKISALKKRNKELVEETESIKKEHQLDISKRKYQYESKKDQYLKFYRLIDSFTSEANISMQEKLIPILDTFYSNFLNASTSNIVGAENKAITEMSSQMQKISFDSVAELSKLRQETNTIKVIASKEILQKLRLLELSYEKITDKSNEMMSALPELIIENNQDKINEYQKEIEFSVKVSNSINDDIIELMRKELNEI